MKKIETSIGEVPFVSGETVLSLSEDVVFCIERSPIGEGEICNSTADPRLARTAAICYFCASDDRYVVANDADESAMLRQFWECYVKAESSGSKMIGYNLFGFDLLFLIRRSWLEGTRVPQSAIMFGTGPYRNDTIIDLRAVWMCGMHDGFVSLNDLAKYFDTHKTKPDMPFHKLWKGNQRDAVELLVVNVTLIHMCAVAMGLTADYEL